MSPLRQKWTGSSTLPSRFTDMILGDPKSFTRRDFAPLHLRYHDMLAHLRASASFSANSSSLSSDDLSQPEPPSPRRSQAALVAHAPASTAEAEPRVKYWNEYDHGSEGGGPDDDDDDVYRIYVKPDDGTDFPGLSYVRAITALPYEKAKQWLDQRKGGPEMRPLLSSPRSPASYSSEEEGYSSADAAPPQVWAAHDAAPGTAELKAARYQDRVMVRGTVGCFAASFAVLAVAATLVWTGKRRLRVEVDAGATLGVMASLVCACAGLGMMLCRQGSTPTARRLAVWAAFVAACLLNGMLLVLVLASSP